MRSSSGASAALEGQATTMPGMSRSTPIALSLWKCPPNPLREASAAIRTTRPLAYCPSEKKPNVAASPRSWSSALWR